MRGKEKVKIILSFFDRYPPICGDMINEKLFILREAMSVLLEKKRRNKRLSNEEITIEALRQKLKTIKKEGKSTMHFPRKRQSRKKIGYFLAGIVDAEGSMGWRHCGRYLQPYFCVAMRDEAIISLFQEYFGFGSKYYRPASKLHQFETGKRENVLQLSNFFLDQCSVQLPKNRKRMEELQRLLNDYTPSPSKR